MDPAISSKGPGIALAALEVDFRKALRFGIYGGLAIVFVSVIGMVETFSGLTIVHSLLSFGYALIFLLMFGIGHFGGKPPPVLEGMLPPKLGARNALAGLIAGVLSAVVLSTFVVIATLINLRPVLLNVSPGLLDLLVFEQSIGVGLAILLAAGSILGVAGGATHLVRRRVRRAILLALVWTVVIGLLQDVVQQVFRGLGLRFISRFLFVGTGGLSIVGAAIVFAATFLISYFLSPKQAQIRAQISQLPESRQRRVRYAIVVSLVLAIAILPQVIGSFLSEVLDLVAIFLLLGLGLNIVVGYAGLLDLGYVAFFAVGAYTTAVLVSPASPGLTPELTFWLALPFILLAAALAGIVVGAPVLRMRGDYLAIVTLGFGEIARLLAQSDWFKPVLGGAQGIISVPNIVVGPLELNSPPQVFYPIVGFVLLAAYVSWRLQDSRIGRAWMAMREDEQVAEIMGVNIVSAKLLAFVIGAILAGVAGGLFAMKIGSVFPHSFDVLKSITVLVLIIVGGSASIPGVALGAFVLVGIPELLREFDEYRLLAYGILLIAMMLVKPEGLIPARWARELREEEIDQDAWMSRFGADSETDAQEVEASGAS